MTSRIALSEPDLRGNEEAYVVEAIRSSWISSTGEFIGRFEREFAQICNACAALSVANGTVALHLALLGLDAGPGDEVIVPSLTYVAAANAVTYVGAEPVLVDVDPQTWCISPEAVAAAIGPKTVGLIAVHLYGHPADMDILSEIAERHGVWIVEDAAEAHFARYRGRPVGSLGTVGTFSFYGNKIVTSGEGGAVVVNDQALAAKLRILRGQGMDPERRYFFPVTGHNFRLTNVACALLCAQLERAESLVSRRREVVELYRELLHGCPGIGFHPVAPWAEPAPWLFCITVEGEMFGETRDDLAARLARAGIETRPLFIPMHRLPPFAAARRAGFSDAPTADALADTGLSLPTHPRLSNDEVERVATTIRNGR